MGADSRRSEADFGDEDAAELVLDRLSRADLPTIEQDLVLSAVMGAEALAACLGGTAPVLEKDASVDAFSPPAVFLSGIAVEGLRGIGARAELGLTPGPGLTLVVGRNGTGKSSFAEAAELALTGTCSRWADKKVKVWQEGWSNLHHDGERLAQVRLAAEGQIGETSVVRQWGAAAALDECESYAQRSGMKQAAVASLGFDPALATWRPFLSYSELGGLLEEGPSHLYDAISRILGLNEWVQAEARLNSARKAMEDRARALQAETGSIRKQLNDLEDERAQAVLVALPARKAPDLTVIADLVGGDVTPPKTAALEALVTIHVGDSVKIVAHAKAIRDALHGVEATAKTDAGRARELAGLLEQALQVHQHAENAVCPVCGTSGVIDQGWESTTRSRIAQLTEEAKAADVATQALKTAINEARRAFSAAPAVLQSDAPGVDAGPVVQLWDEWIKAPEDPAELAEHLESRFSPLDEAVTNLKKSAAVELQRRKDVWQPIAARIQGWLPGARQVQTEAPLVAEIKSAISWLAAEATNVRNERFEPIAKQVRTTYAELCPTSNVSLDDVSLGGTHTRRHVNLTVSVDEIAGQAIAVMSQGELHALTLSLFLPRATLSQSPFRFIMIDDPVQAMDGSRVDGLAQVLSEVAKERQVIVFTHDERLREATRRLRLPAKVLEVSRGRRSKVTVRLRGHPVDDYIDDARAVFSTDGYPQEARRRVIPGLCRNAIEAACSEAAFRRLLAGGVRHEDARDELENARTLFERMALALWGDEKRAGDVVREINGSLGRQAGDCLFDLKAGSHELVDRDPKAIIDQAENIAHHVLKLS